MAKCQTCDGSGRVGSGGWDGRPLIACSECDGTGNYKGHEHALGLENDRLREKCKTLEESVNADSQRLVDQQRQIERLRAFLDFIRELATNPTDGYQTRCIEIIVACNRSLHRDAWPARAAIERGE